MTIAGEGICLVPTEEPVMVGGVGSASCLASGSLWQYLAEAASS